METKSAILGPPKNVTFIFQLGQSEINLKKDFYHRFGSVGPAPIIVYNEITKTLNPDYSGAISTRNWNTK